MLGLEKPDPELGFDIDLELPDFSPECVTPPLGAALGGPGDSPLSEKLQTLTVNRFPDAESLPWIVAPFRERPAPPS